MSARLAEGIATTVEQAVDDVRDAAPAATVIRDQDDMPLPTEPRTIFLGGLFLLAGTGQPVGLAHGGEGVRVGVGEPQREDAQLVHLVDDAADGRLMLGVLAAAGVAGDHAQQCGAVRGMQGRRGTAARYRHPPGEPFQEIADLLVADGHSSSRPSRPARGPSAEAPTANGLACNRGAIMPSHGRGHKPPPRGPAPAFPDAPAPTAARSRAAGGPLHRGC